MTTWAATAIFWQVYPLGFVGAEKQALAAGSAVQHRLPQLLDWLDYLVELGCNGLALNPVFASETHGYDIVDHFAVDARLGDDADIDALITACADLGIRVLFDGVFNHVGRGFPGVRRRVGTAAGLAVRANGSTSTGRTPAPTTVSATAPSRVTAGWSR